MICPLYGMQAKMNVELGIMADVVITRAVIEC